MASDDATTPLILQPPVPGTAGAPNTWQFLGAQPGNTVTVIYGTSAGSTPVPGCAGASVDIGGPGVLGQARASGAGAGGVTRTVPANAAGLTARFQAVERATCTVSPLVEWTF